ncbi:MAG TPA: hypothetical protein VLB76_26720 [Thermoanaerobaculia bacterium]|jgi:hypothetical protein|nr:hypothetical protein [Thermoanaerobaculia bacterium]
MKLKDRISMSKLVLPAVALLGLGFGVISSQLISKQIEPDSSFETRAPESMSELIRESDLIVLGRLISVIDQGTFYGYDKDARRRAALDKHSPTSLGLPFTDYELSAERVILGKSQVDTSRPIILRTLDNPSISTSLSTLRNGDRRVFFLKINPDSRTYSLPSAVSQVDIDGPVAVYFKGTSANFPFGKKLASLDFIKQVERAVSTRNDMRAQ